MVFADDIAKPPGTDRHSYAEQQPNLPKSLFGGQEPRRVHAAHDPRIRVGRQSADIPITHSRRLTTRPSRSTLGGIGPERKGVSMKLRGFPWIAMATLMIVPLTSTAQNLIVNGTFDSDLAGWSSPVATNPPQWVADECCGTVNSGSARFMSAPSDLNDLIASNCMAVTSGAEYDFLVTIKVNPPVGVIGGFAQATIRWFSSATCGPATVIQPSESFVYHSEDYGVWRQRGTRLMAPAGALSAIVTFRTSLGLSNLARAHIDDVRFGPANTVPVGLQAFIVE